MKQHTCKNAILRVGDQHSIPRTTECMHDNLNSARWAPGEHDEAQPQVIDSDLHMLASTHIGGEGADQSLRLAGSSHLGVGARS